MFYRGLKFPHRAVVLLALDSDAACNGFCDHFARRKSAVDFCVMLQSRGERTRFADCLKADTAMV